MIRPLLLVPEEKVDIKRYDLPSPSPASCKVENDKQQLLFKGVFKSVSAAKSYVISLYEQTIMGLFLKTWINSFVTYAEFELGFVLHEIAHIKYTFSGSGEFVDKVNDRIRFYIFNILEDSRIEYKMSVDYPAFSIYFHWLLISVRQNIKFEHAANVDRNTIVFEDMEKVKKFLDDLFNLVRFGIIKDDADIDFINFCMPYVLSSRRGDLENCKKCSYIIYEYIKQSLKNKNNDESLNAMFSAHQFVSIGKDEINDKCKDVQMGSFDKDKEKYGKEATFDPHREIQIEEKESGFYRSTVIKHFDTIQRIKRVFKRKLETAVIVQTNDGDLNMMRQQEAYLNSILGDEGDDYLGMKIKNPSLDIALLRDISGSTSSVQVEYAESIVCILAAVDGINGIRTCQIDFSDRHRVNKKFNEKINESRIIPDCQGGTNLNSSVNELKKMMWIARNKMVMVITDGDICDITAAIKSLQELSKMINGLRLIMIDVGNNRGSKIQTCSIADLPEFIMKEILKEAIL